MKRLALAVFVVLFLSRPAFGTSFLFEFSGKVTSLNDTSGIISETVGTEFGVGSDISFVFFADFDSDGFSVLADGTIVTKTSVAGKEAFFCDLIYSTISQNPGPLYNDYFGINYDTETLYEGRLSSSGVTVDHYGLETFSWFEGQTSFLAFQYIYNPSNGLYSLVGSVDLTLKSISPVPEPSTMILLAIGGVVAIGKRKFSKSKKFLF